MAYVALYRKFRPQTFELVKGQDHVVRALKNQIKTGRIGHAYLFTGTRGTGKTSVAKIFAKAINCMHPVDGEPCNECESCLAIQQGNYIDVVEIDAASNNGVDNIRQIIEEIQYTPVKGKYKVFIIDEAHMITGNAFNAFLKTLEEPPAYAVFILATTEPHKLPITILSRCQRYDFKRISTEVLAENLAYLVGQEGVEAEDKALKYIARLGDGSMRDSISLLDKCIAFNPGEKLTYDNVLNTLGVVDTEVFSHLFRAVYAGDAASALKEIDNAAALGKDLSQFVTDFIWYLRNILMVSVTDGKDLDMLGLSAENLKLLKEDSAVADAETLMRYIRILSELLNQIRYSQAKQILVEIAFIKLAKPQMETDTASLADRIRQLESRPQSSQPVYIQPEPEREQIEITYTPEPAPADIPYEAEAPADIPAPAPQAAAGMTPAQRVVEQWETLRSGLNDIILKTQLKKASPYAEGDKITIYVESKMGERAIRDGLDQLKSRAKEMAGTDIDITVKLGTPPDQEGPALDDEYLSSILEVINMEVGMEDR